MVSLVVYHEEEREAVHKQVVRFPEKDETSLEQKVPPSSGTRRHKQHFWKKHVFFLTSSSSSSRYVFLQYVWSSCPCHSISRRQI